tara:strand:+ start:879 stop:1454 length:576 start_codon:yes stop_codon:yes gene_type:complete
MKRDYASMAEGEDKDAEKYKTKQEELDRQRRLVDVLESAHGAQVLASEMTPPPNGYTEETLAASAKALVAAKVTEQSLVLYLEGLVHAAAKDTMLKLCEEEYKAPKPSTAFCNKTGAELQAEHYEHDYRARFEGVPANNTTMFPVKRQRCEDDINPVNGESYCRSPIHVWEERPPASPGHCIITPQASPQR